jgi:pimeloyl-ACP methyl ester carboxylesterase
LVVVKNAGHFSFLDNSDFVNAVVYDFVKWY